MNSLLLHAVLFVLLLCTILSSHLR